MASMTRLKKLREKETGLIKKASDELVLAHFSLKSGEVIGLYMRFVNNKPWYQILHEHDWESSSFYDGPDAHRAFQLYADLLTSFKSISEAEAFINSIPNLLNKINKFSEVPNYSKFQEYHNLIQKSPKFLGINDF